MVWRLDSQWCGVQLIRSNVEWQRWEGADKWHWDACKRQLWADNLWRSHHQRRLQRGRLKEYLSMQQERERWVVPCQCASTSNLSYTCSWRQPIFAVDLGMLQFTVFCASHVDSGML